MRNSFIASAILALAFLCAGCSNLYETPAENKNTEIYSKSRNVLKISLNPKARSITAGSYDLSKVTEWTLTYKDENVSGAEAKTLSSSSSSISYANGTLTASDIPTGTYEITINGSYIPDNGENKINLAGSKSGVRISNISSGNKTEILVGLSKSGTGSLSINITNGNDYPDDMLITLTNLESLETYSSSKDNENLIEISSDNSGKIISVPELASGWYKLEFYKNDNVEIKESNNEFFIEIADGLTTAGEITLANKFFKSPCIWKTYYINTSNYPVESFNQISDYDDSSTSSELNSDYYSIYCFDKDFNLWIAESDTTLKKHTLQVSDELYSASYTSYEMPNSSGFDLCDICYDTATQYIFILFRDGSNGLLYAMDSNSNFIDYDNGFTLDSEDSSNIIPRLIAVHGGTIYVAGDNNAIYKAEVSVGATVETKNFSKILSLDELDLEGYDPSKHSDDDELYIADLQIGDGAGNNTETLYALVQEATHILRPTNANFFSRGALVEINTLNKTTEIHGWTNTSQEIKTGNSSVSSKTLYSPVGGGTSDESFPGFFGPTRFAAVVPKKIVILDDGIAATSWSGLLKNEDSLVEFDIASRTLTQGGASVTATKPSVSASSSTTGWLSIN